MHNEMRDVILSQHEQIAHSRDVNKNVRVEGDFDSIILAGMGGSGHPGDLLNSLRVTNLPLVVHRSYDMPRLAPATSEATWGKHPLIIVSTYSGNTEEALSVYRAAQNEGYTILGNTSGGTLKAWCDRDGTPLALIDYPGMQPRHTLFASFTGIATALFNSGLAETIHHDLTRAAATLKKVTPALEEPAQKLAHRLKGATPLFIASHNLAFAAQNFKIQVNENAKTPAFWNELPELNHNEMVGFSRLRSCFGTQGQPTFHAVFLRDDDDHPRIRARMDVTRQLYQQWGITVSTFNIKGQTLLEKLFYAVVFGLWTSYYLALAYDIDPIPVEGVEQFKAHLKEIAGEI